MIDSSLLASIAVPGLNYVGATCLCLAMERHHGALYGRAGKYVAVGGGERDISAARRALRRYGWLALGFALIVAVCGSGCGQGLLLWCGSFSVAALLLTLLLPFAPRVALGIAEVAATVAVMLLAWW